METIQLGGRPVAGFGIGGLIVFAEDIEAEQQRMLTSAQGIDQGVDACATLDPTTRAQWKAFYADLSAFAHKKVCNIPFPGRSCDLYATANTSDSVVAWEGQLKAWGAKLATCPNMPPTFDVTGSKPIEPPKVTDALKYVAVAAGVLGGTYVVTKLVAMQRPPAAQQRR